VTPRATVSASITDWLALFALCCICASFLGGVVIVAMAVFEWLQPVWSNFA